MSCRRRSRDCEPEPAAARRLPGGPAACGLLHAMAGEQGAELLAPAAWSAAAAGAQRAQSRCSRWRSAPWRRRSGRIRSHGVEWMCHLRSQRLRRYPRRRDGSWQNSSRRLRYCAPSAVAPSSSVPRRWCTTGSAKRSGSRPERRVLAIEGAGRQASFGKPMEEADLVITSYALLRRDAELYRSLEFTAAILDEAQHIKNPETQNAQAAYRRPCASSIRAHRDPGGELRARSLVADALPDARLPGTRDDFRERYEKPIGTAAWGT